MTDYDVFISYARSASAPAAAALRTAVEKYNRHWYQPRSTRVFLDDKSMSAEASLPGTIQAALGSSKWLVVILTPAAAQRRWVNDEIAWWLAHKGTAGLLLVHQDGILGWDESLLPGGDFSIDSTAVPNALRGILTDEPRWIDLTWFNEEGSLGAEDPRFLDVTLQVFCPIHGLSRDEVTAQNDAKVKGARRLAKTALAVLSLLLVSAVVAGVVAFQQRDVARNQARVATARLLAAQSQALVSSDVGAARLLAAQGWSLHDDSRTRSALLNSVTASPELTAQAVFSGNIELMWASQDHVVTVFLDNRELEQWRPESGRVESVGRLDEAMVSDLTTSRDGAVVGVSYQTDYRQGDEGFNAVALFAAGQRIEMPEATEGPVAISPSGRDVVYLVDVTPHHSLPDVTAGAYEVHRATITDGALTGDGIVGRLYRRPTEMRLDDSGTLIVLSNPEHTSALTTIELSTYQLAPFVLKTRTIGLGGTAWVGYSGVLSVGGEYSFDGKRILPADLDGLGGSRSDPSGAFGTVDPPTVAGYVPRAAVSPDGTRVTTTLGGELKVHDLGSQTEPVLTIPGSSSLSAVSMPDRDHIVSADEDTISLWDLSGEQALLTTQELVGPDVGCAAQNCVPSGVMPNDDGSLAMLEVFLGGLWLYDVASGEADQVPGDVFLDWKDENHYFVSALVDGVATIQLYEAGDSQPSQAWPLPGLAASNGGDPPNPYEVRKGVWQPATGELILATSDSVLGLNPDDGALGTIRSGESVVDLSADGTRVITWSMTNEVNEWSVIDLEDGDTIRHGSDELRFAGKHEVVATEYLSTGREKLLATSQYPELGFANKTAGELVVSPDSDYVLTMPTGDRFVLHARADGTPTAEFSTFSIAASAAGAGFSGDSRYLFMLDISPDNPGAARIRRLTVSPENWADHVCDTVRRPLDAAEWTRVTGQESPASLVCS